MYKNPNMKIISYSNKLLSMKYTIASIILLVTLISQPIIGQYKFFDLKGENKARTGGQLEMSANGDQLIMIQTIDNSRRTQLWEAEGSSFVYKSELGREFTSNSFEFEMSSDFNRIMYVGGTSNFSQIRAYARVFEIQGNTMVQLGSDIEEEFVEGNYSAYAFSQDGNTLAVGDFVTGNGYVKIYRYDGSEWLQLGDVISGNEQMKLTNELAIDEAGDRIAITFKSDTSEYSSNVVIYDFLSDNWTNEKILEDAGYKIKLSADGKSLYGTAKNNIFKVHQEDNGDFELLHNQVFPLGVAEWVLGVPYLYCIDMEVSDNGEHVIMGFIKDFGNSAAIAVIDLVDNVWVERNSGLYDNSYKDYFGRQTEISNDGAKMLIGQARYNLGDGRIFGIYDTSIPAGLYIEAFVDLNENGIYDDNEPNLDRVRFVVDDIVSYVPQRDSGSSILLSEGDYSIEVIASDVYLADTLSYNVSLNSFSPDTIYAPFSPEEFYYEYLLTTGLPICNTRRELKYNFSNNGIRPLTVRALLEYSGVDSLTYNSVPDVVDIGYVELTSEVFEFGEEYDFLIDYNVPDENNVGDTINFRIRLIVSDDSGDFIDTLDEFKSQIVRCAVDPNDKAVSPVGFREESYTRIGNSLDYKIRFQNTGNLPATSVVIEDTLSQYLDFSTFKIGESSHPISSTQYERGTLRFIFDNINLPDSTSNEPESHGFVSFGISPYSDIAEETVIENTALIYFDLNSAIVTNTVINTMITDDDFDQYILSEDCNDKDPLINPGAVEIPNNGIDEDCDGSDLMTSIHDLGEASIRIYPNPATDIINIDVNGPLDYSVSLYSLDGRILLTANNSSTINLNDMSSGIYLLEMIDSKSKQKFFERIIVEH